MANHHVIIILIILSTTVLVNCAKENHRNLQSVGNLEQLFEKYRQFTASKVLTLNISNAILLFLLKSLMMGAFYLHSFYKQDNSYGYGYGSYRHRARSDDNRIPESTWIANYFWAVNTDEYNCVYRLSCEDPVTAKEYASGSRMLLEFFKSNQKYLPYNEKYEKIVRSFQNATKQEKTSCKKLYHCDSPFING